MSTGISKTTFSILSTICLLVVGAAHAQTNGNKSKQKESFDLKGLDDLDPKKSSSKQPKNQQPTTATQLTNGGEDVGLEPEQVSLRRILLRMNQVHQRLVKSQTGKTTQQIQQQITLDLRQLAQMNSANQQRSTSQKNRMVAGQKGNGKQAKSTNKSAAKGNQAGRVNGASNPSDVANKQTTARNQAIGKVWGLLPKRLRSRMRSIPDGQYAAGYIDLVEDYFRRLARD